MSEDTITMAEDAPEATATEPAPGEPFDPERAKADLAKRNRENQSLRARIKELEPLAQRFQELDDAAKSEQQRTSEALTAAQERAVRAEGELLRMQVATEKGLTAAQAKRLVGNTREELAADADDFLASMPAPPQASTSRTPVEALRPGALPQTADLTVDERIAELMKNPTKNRRELISLQNQKLREIATNR